MSEERCQSRRLWGVRIIGCGKAVPGYDDVPGRRLTNAVLAEELMARGIVLADTRGFTGEQRAAFLEEFETSDEWIVNRTGIRERCIADPAIATSDLGRVALLRAIASA